MITLACMQANNALPSCTVHAAQGANTFAIYGAAQEKELTELVPGILNQLGPEALGNLRKLAESYQTMQAGSGGQAQAAAKSGNDSDE